MALLPYLDDEGRLTRGTENSQGRSLVLDVQRMMANAQGFFPYREPG